MTDEFLRTHPTVKANHPPVYMAPSTRKVRFPRDRIIGRNVAYTSKNIEQPSF